MNTIVTCAIGALLWTLQIECAIGIISMQPIYSAREGGEARIVCTYTTAYNTPLRTIQLKKVLSGSLENEPYYQENPTQTPSIKETKNGRVTLEKLSGKFIFTIHNITTADEGKYQCAIYTDKLEYNKNTKMLHVKVRQVAPQLDIQTDHLKENEFMVAKCSVRKITGQSSLPELKWTKWRNGQIVASDVTHVEVKIKNNIKISIWKQMLIKDDNGATITCTAYDTETDEKAKESRKLSVSYAVRDVHINIQNQEYSCVADSNPPASYTWTIHETGREEKRQTGIKLNTTALNGEYSVQCLAQNNVSGQKSTGVSEIRKITAVDDEIVTMKQAIASTDDQPAGNLWIIIGSGIAGCVVIVLIISITVYCLKKQRPAMAVEQDVLSPLRTTRTSSTSSSGYRGSPPLTPLSYNNDKLAYTYDEQSLVKLPEKRFKSVAQNEKSSKTQREYNQDKSTRTLELPKRSTEIQQKSKPSLEEYMESGCEHQVAMNNLKEHIFPKFELDADRIKMIEKVGEGNFGQVWKASFKLDNNYHIEVAVKIVKEGAGCRERKDLINEIKVIASIKPHPHIIRLVGCCIRSDDRQLMLVTDFMPNGNLLHYLRGLRSEPFVQLHDLVRFSWEIAYGMAYLESKQLIHRDLASRNILLDHNYSCKIGDFGLGRDIIDVTQYQSTSKVPCPIRWMSPESIKGQIYTTKSDVWSFGIVLYEIFTIGKRPYYDCATNEVLDRIKSGHKLEKPRACSDSMYDIMEHCWGYGPDSRPTFWELKHQLETNLLETSEHKNAVELIEMEFGYVDMSGSITSLSCAT